MDGGGTTAVVRLGSVDGIRLGKPIKLSANYKGDQAQLAQCLMQRVVLLRVMAFAVPLASVLVVVSSPRVNDDPSSLQGWGSLLPPSVWLGVFPIPTKAVLFPRVAVPPYLLVASAA